MTNEILNCGINDEKVVKVVRSGYLFGSEFPRVGCNQIFVTIIDELAGNK